MGEDSLLVEDVHFPVSIHFFLQSLSKSLAEEGLLSLTGLVDTAGTCFWTRVGSTSVPCVVESQLYVKRIPHIVRPQPLFYLGEQLPFSLAEASLTPGREGHLYMRR